MKVEIELPEIEGYEYTGEYRTPRKGEYGYNHATGLPFTALESNAYMVSHILEKVEPSLAGMLCYVWDDGFEDDGDDAVIVNVNPDWTDPYCTHNENFRNARPLTSKEVSSYMERAEEWERYLWK